MKFTPQQKQYPETIDYVKATQSVLLDILR